MIILQYSVISVIPPWAVTLWFFITFEPYSLIVYIINVPCMQMTVVNLFEASRAMTSFWRNIYKVDILLFLFNARIIPKCVHWNYLLSTFLGGDICYEKYSMVSSKFWTSDFTCTYTFIRIILPPSESSPHLGPEVVKVLKVVTRVGWDLQVASATVWHKVRDKIKDNIMTATMALESQTEAA